MKDEGLEMRDLLTDETACGFAMPTNKRSLTTENGLVD